MRDFIRFLAGVIVLLAAGVVQSQNWQPEWSSGTLSQPREALAAAAAGNDVFFAGGSGNTGISNAVDIYNTSTNTWSTATLSQARESLAAAASGNDVVFAGGFLGTSWTNVVDIYNIGTGTWSTATLSQPRDAMAATAAGNDVFFGGGWGGSASSVVDIFNTSTGTWSTAALSQAREGLAAAAAGNGVVFAGGDVNTFNDFSNVVDIYNTSTGSWSTATLSQARGNLAAAAAGNDIVFAGGEYGNYLSSNVVDIYNTTTGTWSTATLSQPRASLAAAAAGNYVVFAGGYNGGSASNVVDIYDTSTNTWSTATLSQSRAYLTAAAAGNEVFFAGGTNFTNDSNVVDVLHLPFYATISSSSAYTLWLATTVSGRMTLSVPGSLSLATFGLNIGSMSGNAPIDLGSGTLTTGSDNTNTTYAGSIRDSGTLVKTGSGTLALTGSNTYTGATTINQGELMVNGSLVSPVKVNSGGILGGTGSLASVTVNPGGQLSPGDAPGALNISGNLTLLSSAVMDYELGSPADSDEVFMPSGLLSLIGQQFADFNFTTLAGFGPSDYTLIDAGSISGTLGSGTGGIVDGYQASIVVEGDNLVLNVVPEPGTLRLLGAGAVGFLGCLWRPGRGGSQLLRVLFAFLRRRVIFGKTMMRRSMAAVWRTLGGVLILLGLLATPVHAQTFTNLLSFSRSNGEWPMGSLAYSGSTLFGMTLYGGSLADGSAFSIGVDGSGYRLLHSFGMPDGIYPYGDLTINGSTLYGMTWAGGANNGVIFTMQNDGTG